MNLVVRKLLPKFFSRFSAQKLQNPVNPSIRRAWPRTWDAGSGKKRKCRILFWIVFFVRLFCGSARIHSVGRQLEHGLRSSETITLASRNLLIGICFDFVAKGGGPKIRCAGLQPRAVGETCRGIWDPKFPKKSKFRDAIFVELTLG